MDLVIPYISEGRRPLLWISSYIRPVWDFCPSQCSCTSSHGRVVCLPSHATFTLVSKNLGLSQCRCSSSHGRVVCLPSYTTFTLVSKKRCLIRSRKSKKTQTIIYKTLHRKLRIEQHEPH